jgi:predicted membrane protein
MIQIVKILHNERSLSFLSFVIGLGLTVMLFHKPILAKKTLALSIKEVIENVVFVDKKCYQYSAEDATCEIPSSK